MGAAAGVEQDDDQPAMGERRGQTGVMTPVVRLDKQV